MRQYSFSDFNRSLFIDSSNVQEIRKWNATGTIDGVTTNQLIMLKDGVKAKDYDDVIRDICREMRGKPVSVELTDSTASLEKMIKEAKRLDGLAGNIVVKVPLIPDTTKSLVVIEQLVKENIAVNVTAMMTFEQLVLTILATRRSERPSFVSIFWGRSIEDQAKYRGRFDFMATFPRVGMEQEVNIHPGRIVEAAARFLKEGRYENPKIIAGSIRTGTMVGEAFDAGAHIVTAAPDTLAAMLFSQRTIETIQQFDDAWKELQKRK